MGRGLPDHLLVRPQGTNGRPSCRYCHGDVKPPKYSYCSETCRHEFRVLNEPGYARACVFLRDRGVCAACGLDTVAHAGDVLPRQWRLGPGSFHPVSKRTTGMGEWEMDHVFEVASGGHSSLDNLQTLCSLGPKRGCHYEKTRAYAARRAAQRRVIKSMLP
jgi:5-methylcytosine-specific restriction protein A